MVLLLPCFLQAEVLPGLDPARETGEAQEWLPARQAEEDGPEGALLGERLRGIDLVAPGEVSAAAGEVVFSASLEVPSPATLRARLAEELGGPLSEGALMRVTEVVLSHWEEEGFPMVLVQVPEQDFGTGRVRMEVEVGRVGRVGVKPPEHGDAEQVRAGISLERGAEVRSDDLIAQMEWYGRTMFRRPRLFVAPGEEGNTADIVIGLEERRPWRLMLGYENSGPDVLGRDRLVMGAAGLLPNEQVLAWQAVVGTPASSLEGQALHWEIPFAKSHQVLEIDAAYARVAAAYLSAGVPVESEGSSWSLALMHRLPMGVHGGWIHQLGLGFEVKGTDQFLLFGGGGVAPGEVMLAHARVEYEVHRRSERSMLRLACGMKMAPGGLGGRNGDADFAAYDREADASYWIGTIEADAWRENEAGWRVGGRVRGQVADSRLLPAEEFAAGGYQSVRGAAEREVGGDCGLLGSVEVMTPAWAPVKGVRCRFLAFSDQAWVDDRGGADSSLATVGVGVRARFFERLDVRLDHGWRLDEGGGRSHFGFVFEY
ncbi:MAG: hypothetical protein MUF31_00365 [Akkermansiaceae bacterium]|nr:hypothetical protein [Akkermansiaceae bacterium]